MNRRRILAGAFGVMMIGMSQAVIAKNVEGELSLDDKFGSIQFWNEHRVTLGDSRERFDAAFEGASLKEDELGVSYRFPDNMSIRVDICPETNQADTIFVTPYNYNAYERQKENEPRFTRKQTDVIIRLMTPTDHVDGRMLEDHLFGRGVIGQSELLKESVKRETYEWVDNFPRLGHYTVYSYWSFMGDDVPSDANKGGREENIELIHLSLNVN